MDVGALTLNVTANLRNTLDEPLDVLKIYKQRRPLLLRNLWELKYYE